MIIPKGSIDFEKGVWQRVTNGIGGKTALITCPKCGYYVSLSTHTIADNGVVTPSLVCPHECDFHENVTLENWQRVSER